MTPWGKTKFDATRVSYGPRSVPPGKGNDPISECEPLGYPRDLWAANLRPFEFVQTPDRMLQHMQFHDLWRTIWTDGRALPKNPDPAWNGYSVGRWEGHVFVVDTLELVMTLTDPKAYTKPWVGDKINFVRAKVAIFEEICAPSEESHFNDRIRDAAVGKARP